MNRNSRGKSIIIADGSGRKVGQEAPVGWNTTNGDPNDRLVLIRERNDGFQSSLRSEQK